MKSLKKIALGCAATMALSVALSASAFAADLVADTDYAYDVETGTVTVNNSETVAALTDGEYTVLIIDVTGLDAAGITAKEAAITGDDILYINQSDDVETDFAIMGLKNGLTEGNTYLMKIGGTNVAADGILRATFTVGGEDEPAVIIGDVTGEGDIDPTDAAYVIQTYLGARTLTGNALTAANADKDAEGNIDPTDAAYIIQDYLGARTLNPAE